MKLKAPRANEPYDKAIDWLYGTQLLGMKLGLENVRHLLAALGNPQERLQFIHVAGTNGKGSVCAMIDSICRCAGIRSGLFTSPHLIRFNERIQVNGNPIPDDACVERIEKIRSLIEEKHHPTFFEITTALALDYFRAENADIIILETGLGGRLDATNVVDPLVSVLTAIDLDHQRWLGDTLPKIAEEKGGIIKEGRPVVSGPQFPEVREILERIADRRSAPITFVEKPLKRGRVGLIGAHQRVNAAIALAAVDAAALHPGPDAAAKGLEKVSWPGRYQRIGDRIVLDSAHNPAATSRLVQTWREHEPEERATILFGGLRDKDLGQMVALLRPIAARFLIAPIPSQRAATPSEIARLIPWDIAQTECDSVSKALATASRFQERILVTGSTFLVGEVLSILELDAADYQKSDQ